MKQTTMLLPEFKTAPAVFAVKKNYQIIVPVKSNLLFWVTVNGKKYYDNSNGVLRSSVRVHRVNVPMTELDKAKEYIVSYRKIIDRKPYFPQTEPEVSATYAFKPLNEDENINIYHLSDTHGNFEKAALVGKYFDDNIDLLVLNGDIPDHSGSIENFDLIFKLCEAITQGSKPCVFSRGNHDTRGFFAENIAEYSPTDNGHSYYSFRLGKLWGIVLDCGEDKDDSHDEYGHTVCCHDFRIEQTEYLKSIIYDAEQEYNEKGVEHRIVIVHNPFSFSAPAPFDIEKELYKEWLTLLGENICPDIMLSGHLHAVTVSNIGGKLDSLGQICPVVIGSKPVRGKDGVVCDFIGTAITIEKNSINIAFTNSNKSVVESHVIKLNKTI